MKIRRSFALLPVAFAVAALTWESLAIDAHAQAAADVTHVVCIANETGEALTVWISEPPETSRPRAGFSSLGDRATHCFRRVATSEVDAAVVLGAFLQPEATQTVEDRQRFATQMQALSHLSSACEIPAALIEPANVERRPAVWLRVFNGGEGHVCVASTGTVPVGAYSGEEEASR